MLSSDGVSRKSTSCLQRGDLRLRIRNVEDDHAIDMNDLAASDPGGGLGAGDVVRIAVIDILRAGTCLALVHDEGPEPTIVSIFCIGSVSASFSRIMKQNGVEVLAKASSAMP